MFLSVVFVGLSLDEMASLHEMSNAPLRSLLHSGPALYFPGSSAGSRSQPSCSWSVATAAGAASNVRLVRDLWSDLHVQRRGVRALAALCMRVVPARSGRADHGEESLEMIGVAAFIVAIARFCVTEGGGDLLRRIGNAPSPGVWFSPRRVFRVMLVLAFGLAAINMALQALRFLTPLAMAGLVRLFDLAREATCRRGISPLLACGALAGMIAVAGGAADRHSASTGLTASSAYSPPRSSIDPRNECQAATQRLPHVRPAVLPWITLGERCVDALAIRHGGFLLRAAAHQANLVVASAIFAGALGVTRWVACARRCTCRNLIRRHHDDRGPRKIGVLAAIRGLLGTARSRRPRAYQYQLSYLHRRRHRC